MSLSVGDRLGHYEVLSLLGKGGMGEVYRARDTKLKREVAIKILPEAFARDAQRMARFQREAEVLASLNHPNIATIHGVEDRALIMELVEGTPPKGPLPLDEAWKIASQIAAALEYAHERGIMHRDLKPANILITPDGAVKLLDFGLAKAFSNQREPSASPEDSPTLTLGATEVGVILGTAAYMAPEQARGKAVDKRADIWAFGVVLYELLTGERLFTGEDAAETLAAVIHKQPDLARVPPEARRLLEECLQKNPKQRLRDIGDAQRLLGGQPPAQPAAVTTSSRFGMAGWIAAGVLALVTASVSFLHFRETAPPEQTLRYTIALAESRSVHSLAISPDGRKLVIAAWVGGKRQLWLRPMDALQAQPMPFTEDATYPFWSPDSRFIGFFALGKLKKVSVSGGPAQSLCDVVVTRGGSWNRDDVIVFAPANGSIQRVSAAGGVRVDVIKATKNETAMFKHPVFLPDGRHFLYTVAATRSEVSGVYVGSLDGPAGKNEDRRILTDVSGVIFAPAAGNERADHILFVRDATLMAAPFDARSAQISGDVFPVAEGVILTSNGDYAPATVSENGTLAYLSGGAGVGMVQLTWVDRSGKVTGTAGPPGVYRDFRLAPDEKRIAFDRADQSGNTDVWVMDLVRGTTSRLTSDPAIDNLPIWSPDGLRILYPNNRTGVFDLYIKAATSAGQEALLLKMGSTTGWGTSWSRDGRFILYQIPGGKTGQDLWIAPQAGDGKPFPYLNSQFNESEGSFSPDGRWVAYVSDETGRSEVHMQAFPLSSAKAQISTGGGTEPNWRNDGRELFYLAADLTLMAVPIQSGATLDTGVPKPLFPISAIDGRHSFAPGSDGQRFLVGASVGGEKAVPVTVVLNWQAGRKK